MLNAPKNTRRQFAEEKSFVPMPYPVRSTVMGGMGVNWETKCFKIAAPVGVHNSASIVPLYMGTSLNISVVAGVGTGRIP